MTENTIVNNQDNQLQGSTETASEKSKAMRRQYSAYEAPTVKEFLWVILVFATLIALSWVAYFKLGWFH
jgi:translation initiation factor 2B subunit (eIF-2B alpha/beta/delta family)